MWGVGGLIGGGGHVQDYRKQQVDVKGEISEWVCVPQEATFGPLLFSLYFNSVSADIKSEIRLFAADCVSYFVIRDAEDSLNLLTLVAQSVMLKPMFA